MATQTPRFHLPLRRTSDWLMLVGSIIWLALVFGTLLYLLFVGTGRHVAARGAGKPAAITSPRLCAAAQVYATATADDWSQRASIAQAALNRYAAGPAPSCGDQVAALVAAGLQPRRWQTALDAVDAVRTGSYRLPPACARANTIALHDGGVGPGPQCVIAGMAFAEVSL